MLVIAVIVKNLEQIDMKIVTNNQIHFHLLD